MPRDAIRSLILGHSMMYEIKTFGGMSGAKFGLLWDRVLYSPYAHSPDSDSLKDMLVSGTQRSVQTPQSIQFITV